MNRKASFGNYSRVRCVSELEFHNKKRRRVPNMTIRLLFKTLYAIIILLPLIVSFILRPRTNINLLFEISISFALIGFMMLSLQILFVGRFKWIEKQFGLDILIRNHRNIAVIAVFLIVLHPLLLVAASGGDLAIILSFKVPWQIWMGRTALIVLIINVGISYYQGKLGLKFETWRVLHDSLVPLIIGLVFAHSFFIGDDLQFTAMKWIWITALILSFMLFGYHLAIRPWLQSYHNYTVTEVRQSAPKVWTIKFSPGQNDKIKPHLPGQFHFLTFHRRKGLPEEEHHWTISSSPTEKHLASTIKELGDFTATIGETKPGDTVTVDGSYGRFSYLLHSEEKELLFIAGGIGITPVRSMIKHLHDTNNVMPVILLYANNDEKSITFKDELEDIAISGIPQLKVVHVLSKPETGWTGETGFVDQAKIDKYCGRDLSNKGFYLCGPKPFLDAIVQILQSKGVAPEHIHMELFSFLG
jgi:predicted ferric reductase